MNYIRLRSHTIFAMAIALTVFGCAMPGARGKVERIEIRLLPADRVAIGNKVVALVQAPAALRRAGATPATSIVVLAPKEYPSSKFPRITGILRSKGFGKVMFARPRKAKSSVEKSWWQR
ncbi:MAG: hypothetical protein QGI24_08550 [Kiritimatiellia bacterium]|nr:hypothetical protein [Kiritimatiellia bacterium]MDP6848822.1 hypothetical protein [Kiritimatiellia bacterium]